MAGRPTDHRVEFAPADGPDRYQLSEDERRGIERGLSAMREGRFAREEQIAAILRKARSSRA
jgi:predicted transcriptional regulator